MRLNKNLIRIWSFSHSYKTLVYFFSPIIVRGNLILVLVQRSTNNEKLEQFQDELASLDLIEGAVCLALFHDKSLSKFIAYFDSLKKVRHGLGNVLSRNDF